MIALRAVFAAAAFLLPVAASAADVPVVTLSVPVAVSGLTAPAGTTPKLYVGCATSTAQIGDLNIAPNLTAIGSANAFQATGSDKNGAPGRLIDQNYLPVPLDATGSYAGPPIVFTFFASSVADAKLATSYACQLFSVAPYVARFANAPVAGTPPYVKFAPNAGGSVR